MIYSDYYGVVNNDVNTYARLAKKFIEEFIYWAFCPGIVAMSYIILGKKMDKFINPISFSKFISAFKIQKNG